MQTSNRFPLFEEHFAFLNQFILGMVKAYHAGEINSWDELDQKVRMFFTQEVMDTVESNAPGWKKMSSYSDGITLTHVMCVFLGMLMLPEFQALSAQQQQMAKWIILFHDIDKFPIRGKRDNMHAFNSAVVAANILPSLGFPIPGEYHDTIDSWSTLTRHAFISTDVDASPKPDNQKLPEILSGIDQLLGENTPASLIIKTVLLHISLDVDINYPTPTPLSETEIRRFISPDLQPLLKVMMLSDNEGWSLFDPEIRQQQSRDTHLVFERIQELIGTAK